MPKLVLDASEYDGIQRWRNRAGDDSGTRPLRWYDLIDRLSISMSGEPAGLFHVGEYLSRSSILFTWNPSGVTVLAAALSGRNLAHLCWGGLGRSGYKGLAERLLLGRAGRIFVNDPVTAGEVCNLARREAILVPYAVDATFFEFRPVHGRSNFLFCCAVNDRDPEVLLALARCGFPVVWNATKSVKEGPYGTCHPNLRIVYGLSWPELREFYQNCACFVLPTTRDVHAAGQTAILEALACGAPVVVSASRVSNIFDSLESLKVAYTSDVSEWSTQLSALLNDETLASKAIASRAGIERTWAFDRCLFKIESEFRAWDS